MNNDAGDIGNKIDSFISAWISAGGMREEFNRQFQLKSKVEAIIESGPVGPKGEIRHHRLEYIQVPKIPLTLCENTFSSLQKIYSNNCIKRMAFRQRALGMLPQDFRKPDSITYMLEWMWRAEISAKFKISSEWWWNSNKCVDISKLLVLALNYQWSLDLGEDRIDILDDYVDCLGSRCIPSKIVNGRMHVVYVFCSGGVKGGGLKGRGA